jgi:hypothetical protein
MRNALPVLLLVPAAALASSPFDGTWKARADSIKVTGKPDVITLANGEYHCVSCVPELKVPADGKEHAVTGHPYYDAVTVTVVSPTTIEAVYKMKGKETVRETDVVSADGKSYTGTFVDKSGAKEATGSFSETRVAAGPAGSHAISGSWQAAPGMQGNDAAMTIQYQMAGDHLKANFNGRTYDAPLDGTQVPLTNDPGKTMVSVKRVDANTLQETDRRDGKVTDEVRIAAAPDGKTLNMQDKDVAHGQTTTLMFDKQ